MRQASSRSIIKIIINAIVRTQCHKLPPTFPDANLFNCLESWGQELNCQDKVLSYEFLLVPICRDNKVTKDLPNKMQRQRWYYVVFFSESNLQPLGGGKEGSCRGTSKLALISQAGRKRDEQGLTAGNSVSHGRGPS